MLSGLNISETKNKLGDYVKAKLMGKDLEVKMKLRGWEGGKMDKYQVS